MSEDAAIVWLNVAVNVPIQALPVNMSLNDGFDYVWYANSSLNTDSNSVIFPRQGSIVLISWANRQCLGVVLSILIAPRYDKKKILSAQLMPHLGDTALPDTVLKLAAFASQYYYRPIGEVLLPTISTLLTTIPFKAQPINKNNKDNKDNKHKHCLSELNPLLSHQFISPTLTDEQVKVLNALSKGVFAVHLLYGVTGSGKTEVYLSRAAQAIAQGKRVLILVPEIVLVHSMLSRVKIALPNANCAVLHSDISAKQRRITWIDCLFSKIHIVIGTRLAIFAPLSNLGLIVVDEEHDLSYKQQDGVRYCARNLAIVRGQLEQCPVILGSATPSLDTWLHAFEGKYHLHRMLKRAKSNILPQWNKINLLENPSKTGLSEPILTALNNNLSRGEQSLVFLNRRGFAPVLTCMGCGWMADCMDCSSYFAVHKLQKTWRLICHHCSTNRLPHKSCPQCGSIHLEPEGQGTQAIEDSLLKSFPLARIARLDSDITYKKQESEHIIKAMVDHQLDILVGTQMTAKGHDFPALSTVVVVGCDSMLYSPDYRAVERLFALLIQVAGRAGRDKIAGTVWLQTRQIDHPVFLAVLQPTVDQFYNTLLHERYIAGLPPYTYHAVLRASHSSLDVALSWLFKAKALLNGIDPAIVRVSLPTPMLMSKIATKHRAQMLFESNRRTDLHKALSNSMPIWLTYHKTLRSKDIGYGTIWHLEVDPIEV